MSSTVTDLPTKAMPDLVHTLDSLSRLSFAALQEVYKAGAHPTNLNELVGEPQGRMLAVRGTGKGLVAQQMRKMAAAGWFPWAGKSFSRAGKKGRGINRVHLWGRHQLFPFEVTIKPSAIDGQPAAILSYDLEDNPPLARRILDEIREVSPGLWMGPALWRRNDNVDPTLLMWFALEWR